MKQIIARDVMPDFMQKMDYAGESILYVEHITEKTVNVKAAIKDIVLMKDNA